VFEFSFKLYLTSQTPDIIGIKKLTFLLWMGVTETSEAPVSPIRDVAKASGFGALLGGKRTWDQTLGQNVREGQDLEKRRRGCKKKRWTTKESGGKGAWPKIGG